MNTLGIIMDSHEYLPDAEIKPRGKISKNFLELGIKTFWRLAIMFIILNTIIIQIMMTK